MGLSISNASLVYHVLSQVCLLADSVGSLLAYDALCKQPSQARVDTSEGEEEAEGGQRPGLVRQSSSRRTQTASRHLSVNNHEAGDSHFHFDVGHFFLLGSPLPIVLAHRQTAGQPQPPRPNCVQVTIIRDKEWPQTCNL